MVTGTAGLLLALTGATAYYSRSKMTPVELVQRAGGGPAVEIEVARVAKRSENPRADLKAILDDTNSWRVARAVARHLECGSSDTECLLTLVDALEMISDGGFHTADTRAKLGSLSGLDLPSDATPQVWREALTASEDPPSAP
jgi:hypothetical protein